MSIEGIVIVVALLGVLCVLGYDVGYHLTVRRKVRNFFWKCWDRTHGW